MASTSSRRRSALLLGFVLLLINFPLLHGWWLDRQLAADGIETSATVVGVDPTQDADRSFVSVRFDETVDPAQDAWPAVVDSTVAEGLAEGEEMSVRVVPGTPQAFEVEGQVHSRTGLYSTLAADALIAIVAWLLWRRRGQRAEADETDATDQGGTGV